MSPFRLSGSVIAGYFLKLLEQTAPTSLKLFSRPAAPRFRYQALRGSTSFRLMKLYPDEFDQPLQCDLVPTSLEENPDFEAVSYVWGSEKNKVPLVCGDGALQITQNLDAALRRFRDTSSVRTLWVDSVCIDQTHTTEKNRQVAMMGKLYSNSRRVLIWLGEEDNHNSLAKAVDAMKILAPLWDRMDEISERVQATRSFKGTWENLDDVSTKFGLPDLRSDEFVALNRFWKRPWFSRAWTFQESFLAQDRLVYFGSWVRPMKYLLHTLLIETRLEQTVVEDDLLSTEAYRILPMLSGSRKTRAEKLSLLELLRDRRGSGCKYAGDLVYSVLGTTTDETTIVPDYEKSFVEIFAETALSLIHVEGDLSVLGESVPTKDSSSISPTWVADWRVHRGAEGTYSQVFAARQNSLFYSTGRSRPQCSLSDNRKKLTIRGYQLDHILELVPALSPNLEAFVQTHIPRHRWQSLCRPGESLSDMLVRIKCLNLTPLEITTDTYPDNREGKWDAATLRMHRQIVESAGLSLEGKSIYDQYDQRIRSHLFNCQLMITHDGRLGIAPENAQTGDIVTLMLGGRVPLLVRPKSADECTLVGECFVDQVMEGEVFEKREDLLASARDFVLV